MKVNLNKLQAAINVNPTKRSQAMSVQDLSGKIEDGSLTVPLYQRGLSWNEDKAVALFNYQLFGKAPVAPLSLNEIGSNDEVPQLSFITREIIDANNSGKLSVVDGQQRLTTNYKAYANDESFSNIVLDVTQAKFKKIAAKPNDSQIPVGILLNKDQQELTQYVYNKKSMGTKANEVFPLLVGIRSKILGYNYTIHIADNMTEVEQIEWFEVLNNAGSRVSHIQLSLSKLRMHDFDMYSRFITPYQQTVNEYGFSDLFSPFSSNDSYPIASLNPAFEYLMKDKVHSKNYAPIPSDTKEKMLIKLTLSELSDISNLTLKSLKKALEFIFNNDLQDNITKMQHVMYLTGYFVFNQNQENLSNLVTWTRNVVFDNVSNGEKRNIFDKLIQNNFEND